MGVPFPNRRPIVLGALFAAITLVLTAGTGFALEGIAVVDYQEIFDKYEGTSDAQQTLDRELKDWDNDARTMRDEIDTLRDEIESQRLMLSEDRLREKEDELEQKMGEYERFAQEIWGVNGTAAKRNAELTAPIAEKIIEIIARIGDEMNLEIILDAGTGGVVWAKDNVNVTETVLQDLQIAIKKEEDAAADAPDPAQTPPVNVEPDGGEHE